MRNIILENTGDHNEYIAVMDAVSGLKEDFSQEDVENLTKIYRKYYNKISEPNLDGLIRLLLVLDTAADGTQPESSPLFGNLDGTEANAMRALYNVCKDWEPNAEQAAAAKTAALSGDVSEPLALALARAALDVYAGQKDFTAFREDIKPLANLLKQADEADFSDASLLLIQVRERVRGRGR